MILGAGASADYGFPTGSRLAYKIHECLTSQYKDIGSKLERLGYTQDELYKFQDRVKELEFPTLDRWIQENNEYAEMAKAAIAVALIQCESDEAIQEPNPPKKHWYRFLFREMLGENADGGEGFKASAANLRIITFNYDRSLEYYFFKALTNMYPRRAKGIYDRLNIRHMYGCLGNPNIIDPTDPYSRPFDNKVTDDAIDRCMHTMSMVTEIKMSPDRDISLYQAFNDANLICFLGFGYDPQNIFRLMGKRDAWAGKKIYGTAYYLTETRRHEITERFPDIVLGDRDVDVQTFLEKNLILY